ncbi:solute carrier family 43 member 3-like isoform X2 [Centruroides sculpturatus]|uniref:solute carrier family 43 member 3-like isoform X2 n=1 Tax=Centruroides sculpturatus TaxID=218467 RepID=UPI000C6DD199|nr:solute carrier family 43 member 3-like isoform X2 [Centruroides sculpturatus]
MATSSEFSRAHKVCVIIIVFLEYLLFSGIIYGWADLVYVLKLQGVFSNNCNNNVTISGNETIANKTKSCKSQDDLFDLAFTISSFNKALAAFLSGFLLDWVGLRITRIISSCFILIGGTFLALCDKRGSEIRYGNFQISNLFPKYKMTIMSFYNGAFCGSPAVLLLLKYCYDQGISYSAFFYVWTGISSSILLTSFFLLPKMNIIAVEDKEEIVRSINDDEERQPLLSRKSGESYKASTNNIFRSIFSISFIFHVVSNCLLALSIIIYLGSFNWWITKLTSNQEEVSRLSEIFGFSQLPMIIVSPFIGILLDSAVKKAQEEEDPILRKKKSQRAGFYSLIICSTVATSMIACRTISNVTAVYFSLVFYVLSRPILNSVSPGYIRIRFPQEHFNKLIGIFGTVTCISSVVQYPLFLWMQEDFMINNLFLIGLLALTFINPLHLLCLKPTDV